MTPYAQKATLTMGLGYTIAYMESHCDIVNELFAVESIWVLYRQRIGTVVCYNT